VVRVPWCEPTEGFLFDRESRMTTALNEWLVMNRSRSQPTWEKSFFGPGLGQCLVREWAVGHFSLQDWFQAMSHVFLLRF
jgi:hypothetical protein